jgi:hypothetical protein
MGCGSSSWSGPAAGGWRPKARAETAGAGRGESFVYLVNCHRNSTTPTRN